MRSFFFARKVPNCMKNKRTKRDTPANDSTEDEGQPATIQVYSGLYVNENAEVLDNDQDSVFAEKVMAHLNFDLFWR